MENIMEKLKKTLAENIKHRLEITNKTQREMCKTLGFKENTVSDWINAKSYPQIDKIEMMANFFNCRKSDLIESETVSLSSVLSPAEKDVLKDFSRLNLAGQKAATKIIKSFVDDPDYAAQAEKEKMAETASAS